ncbi:AMP-binding protein [Mangrovihabitans endophyticus]|uniref:AMP-dependent synthetase and ligase n=1 Tax=Mangrovihabitans endophyticus TaxID=1751298 RepID=A0A8J3FLK7_9ACTN|nr:AMP-binding protein [Mangrovihabitans endophyticus]GGK78211.1 AMP-dependent synthetase and ligase [Mangrovihabitans endophyticus]
MPAVVAVDAVDYRHVAATTDAPITFFDSRGPIEELPRAAAVADARAVAAGLAHHRLDRHDRVVLLLPTGSDYYGALLGCLLAGVAPCTVATPATPHDAASAGVRHLHAAVAAVRPAAVIVGDARLADAVPAGVPALTVAELRAHGTVATADLGVAGPQDVHHVQLTSGSTSSPKAVVLTHANVAANLAALDASTRATEPDEALFTWLPLYHDMGLVQVLFTLTRGVRLDLMSPLAFVRDPLSWLRHMSARRSTLTAAPPFAYRAAADRYTARPDPSIDLSALRQAYVGAEPIPVDVLTRFRDTFEVRGLADEVLVPCYGMAETVLATALATECRPRTGTSFGRVRWRRFDRVSLDEHRVAAPAVPGRPARSIVSCGVATAGLTVRICDETGAELAEGQVGAVRVMGSSVMAGYLTDGGLDAPPEGWHDTGDLGVRYDGQLYIVGRTKEMLIVRGRNLPPYDIEDVIEQHPDAHAAAVFSHPADGKATEPVVAVVETRAPEADRPDLRAAISTRVREVFGVSLSDVVFVGRGGIPRTSSGKRRRAPLRNDYLAGRLSCGTG